MVFGPTDDVRADRDEQGNVQHLEHFQAPFVAPRTDAFQEGAEFGEEAPAEAATPQALAEQYLRAVSPIYGIDESMLPDTGADASLEEAAMRRQGPSGKLELTEEKDLMGTTTISYQQTYSGLPIWEAGVSVTIQPEPMRVTASQSSIHHDVALPEEAGLLAENDKSPQEITSARLKKLLGIDRGKPVINGTTQLIYQYDPNRRYDPESRRPTGKLQGAPPTLPLPPLPETIKPGQHYVVTEVLFTLPVEGFGEVHWRAFVEVDTGAVLYLRAFVACATGMIFKTDPLTAGAASTVTPTSTAGVLNPFRSTVTLAGLATSNPQRLSGQFVKLVEIEEPTVAPPSQPNPPAAFTYNAPSREFAAVNAYHHCDWLFRLMHGMGFNIASYFNGTTFPVPVDACAVFDGINAFAPGNVSGNGSGGFKFGLAGGPFPAVSIAADVRVVLHEFGHALLWDSVHSPNFGFAHSAGDSLAAILLDPESALRNDPVRRFQTFPWISISDRSHGRDVAAGWAWGGSNDIGSYESEQILSTTHFRLYRSIGGDSTDLNRRKLAARQAAYLIFRAIGSLATNPVTPTPQPSIYATALMNADIGTSNFEGYRGGTFHKVIRWSFEKQGLYQPAGAPTPVKMPGAPPKVDVYINDGRNGEYQYQPVHWDCHDIWNRLAASAGGGGGVHEAPVVGQTNFAYVRVKNRGVQQANNVVVRGYSANPGVGLTWPGEWTPMITSQITVAGGIPPGGSVIVGPFKWTPQHVGHECMFMEVSADGDLSNINPATFFPCAQGPTPEWRLVPFDNNIGQRNVVPVPGGGGVRGLLTGFIDRRFTVRNQLEKTARVEVKAQLPPFLTTRGWGIQVDQKNGGTLFSLPPEGRREVTITLTPGREFTAEELSQARGNPSIRVLTYFDGSLAGGMTYELNPGLTRAPIERRGDEPIPLTHPNIEAAVRNAQLTAEGAGFTDEEAETVRAETDDATAEGHETNLLGSASQFLSKLDLPDVTTKKVKRVKLSVEIELDDD